MVMGYQNGHYAWSAEDWARFPHAAHVTIDVTGADPNADVLDIEAGDASVSEAPTWVKEHNKTHPFPAVLYCSRSTLTPLFNTLATAGLHVGHDFRTWIATLDGTETVPDMTGVVAVQYAGESRTGGHYDQSKVYDDTWKPTAAPTPPPPVVHTAPPPPPGEWLDGVFTGRGLDGRLYRTDFFSATGHWSTPVQEP